MPTGEHANSRANLAKGDFRNLDPETRRARQSAGGKKAAENRRARKKFAEDIEMILNLPIKTGEIAEIQSISAAKGKNIDAQTAIIIAMVNKARQGSVMAAEWLRDTVGEKPSDVVENIGALPVVISGEDELAD